MRILLFITLISSIFLLTNMSSRDQGYVSPRYVTLAEEIQGSVARKLAKRYDMSLFGLGGGMADSVNIICLSFQIRKPLTKEELRYILIDCVEEILAAFNANEEIRPYLLNYPFLPKNVEMVIFITDPTGRDLYDPTIAVASATNGKVNYFTNDPDNEFRYKSEFTESYEEALKIVRGKVTE
jgi:hypothetical protein